MRLWTKRAALVLTLSAIAITASACTRIRNHQGYVADSVLIESVQPGVDNRDSVLRMLGRPSFESQFDEGQWYYFSRETRQLGFNRPSPKEQTLLVVSFDNNGTVSAVDQRGMEQVVDVNMVRDKTQTLGRKSGLLEDIFGNIGAVGAGGGGAGGGGTMP